MDMFCWLLLTGLLLQASKVRASDGIDVFGAEGKSVTFHLQKMTEGVLTWSFRGETILVIKLGASPELVYSDKSFTSRVAFPNNGSTLTISQLRRSDAGTYLAKNNDVKVNFTLHVYRELPEPTVSCTGWNCSAERCFYTLRCAVDYPGDSSFFWSYNERPESKGSELVVERLRLGDLDPPLYTCTAWNPVSSRNTTVLPSALCAESTARIPAAGTSSSRLTVIVVGLMIGLLVLLAIIFITVKLKGAAAENMTVYAEVGDVDQTDDEKMSSRAPGCLEQEKSLYSTVEELHPTAQPWNAHVLLPATGEPSPSWTQGDEHHGNAVLNWDKSSDCVLPSG
ncbi:SLAM family member 7-like isoform X6 [Numida meleagris]|uniref:SLAM family member 7-like isoform X6 n=1 Tax=Numida meleagris TaxID=8996 RepID=UPI000B3DD9C1|nr:SLAM family member 7-like isoform X6 [Numida meleagris]